MNRFCLDAVAACVGRFGNLCVGQAVLVPLAMIAVLSANLSAEALTYSFSNIVDSNAPAPKGLFTSFTPPAISGEAVAFRGSYFDSGDEGLGTGGTGIFAGIAGLLTTVAKTGDALPYGTLESGSVWSDPTISGQTVAFAADYRLSDGFNFGNGVFTSDGSSLSTVVKSGDIAPSGTFVRFGRPAISGSAVAFLGLYPQRSGIFLAAGGTVTPIAKSGDAAPFGTFSVALVFGDPSISNNSVAFLRGYVDDKGLPTTAIFRGNGSTLETVIMTGDVAPTGTFVGLDDPSIGENLIAFRGRFDGFSNAGVFTENGSLTKLAMGGDPGFSGTFVAFGATTTSKSATAFIAQNDRQVAIFSTTGGTLTPVIKTGDPLFGSFVTGLRFGRFGLDPGESGNLAFLYQLSDGRFGIAVASPVPEPITVIQYAIAMIPVFLSRVANRGNRTVKGQDSKRGQSKTVKGVRVRQ